MRHNGNTSRNKTRDARQSDAGTRDVSVLGLQLYIKNPMRSFAGYEFCTSPMQCWPSGCGRRFFHGCCHLLLEIVRAYWARACGSVPGLGALDKACSDRGAGVHQSLHVQCVCGKDEAVQEAVLRGVGNGKQRDQAAGPPPCHRPWPGPRKVSGLRVGNGLLYGPGRSAPVVLQLHKPRQCTQRSRVSRALDITGTVTHAVAGIRWAPPVRRKA